MTPRQVLVFIRKQGVVLESAKGPVPSLAEQIVGEPIRGSWWAHPRSHEIFDATRAVRDSSDVLVCRLVDGKITYVHRRLWPALFRVSKRFPRKNLAQVREVHSPSGQHTTREIPFPKWVPPEVLTQASDVSEQAALSSLGPWCAPRAPDWT